MIVLFIFCLFVYLFFVCDSFINFLFLSFFFFSSSMYFLSFMANNRRNIINSFIHYFFVSVFFLFLFFFLCTFFLFWPTIEEIFCDSLFLFCKMCYWKSVTVHIWIFELLFQLKIQMVNYFTCIFVQFDCCWIFWWFLFVFC